MQRASVYEEGVLNLLDGDVQWKKLEDTLFSVTCKIHDSVFVPDAILTALSPSSGGLQAESPSQRRPHMLQAMLDCDVMLMREARPFPPSATDSSDQEYVGRNRLCAAQLDGGRRSGETQSESVTRNAHRNWNFVVDSPRSDEPVEVIIPPVATITNNTPDGIPTGTPKVITKWAKFKQDTRRRLSLQP